MVIKKWVNEEVVSIYYHRLNLKPAETSMLYIPVMS